MAHATSEVIWLHNLLQNLQFFCSSPTILYCDNQAALYLAANPVFHERTKHIEVDCHFIREHLQNGLIKTEFLPTKQQQADILTKALGSKKFQDLSDKIGVHQLKLHLEGEY